MSLEKVRIYLKKYALEKRILEFDVSSATVELAAKALGCPPARIAKTLSFATSDGPVLIVVAGDARIDNRKYKDCFGLKARMLPSAEVQQFTGHMVGGVCPFALDSKVTVYLDCSLKRFATVFPACGSPNSAIELTIAELEQCSDYAGWVDVCKDWCR